MQDNGTPEEVWREIPGYDGHYEVSDQGRVRSWYYRKSGKRQAEPHYIKAWISRTGYQTCKLWNGRSGETHSVHRLMMLAFLGRTERDVNHRDGNKLNNALDNLEYMTHQENMRHSVDVLGRKHGKRGVQMPTERDREIRKLAEEGMFQREIAKYFGLSQPYIHYIVSGKMRPEIR